MPIKTENIFVGTKQELITHYNETIKKYEPGFLEKGEIPESYINARMEIQIPISKQIEELYNKNTFVGMIFFTEICEDPNSKEDPKELVITIKGEHIKITDTPERTKKNKTLQDNLLISKFDLNI